MSPVWSAARSAVRRRRLQTLIVGLVVLLSTATGVIGLALLVVSHAPFDAAFDRASGAQVTTTVAASVPAATVRATATASGVTAAAGPFAEVTTGLTDGGGFALGSATVVGRSDLGGPVDKLSLDTGKWLTGPGQIVLSREFADSPVAGFPVTLSVAGHPTLTVVGIADSVTGTADAWVWPTQDDVLHASGASTAQQMLYRFASGADASTLRVGMAGVTAALPAGAVTGTSDYLAARTAANRNAEAFAPFVAAFAVLGLVLSVLITSNVVGGAVVSGYRTIGVLKTLGFTPRQVVAVYVAQVVVPSIVGCAAGVALGVLLAASLLRQTERAYDLPNSVAGVPAWIMAVVAGAALVLVALAAFGPALRAGRLAANQAISVGRAPRTGRGFRLRRRLAGTRLPRAVALGAGMPLARPARSAGAVVALLLGVVTLVFAVGLTTSLTLVDQAFNRTGAVQVTIPGIVQLSSGPDGGPPGAVVKPGPGAPPGAQGPQEQDMPAIEAVVDAQAGTLHSVVDQDRSLHLAGFNPGVTVESYSGDAQWAGFAMISGRWYANAGEVVASSYTLRTSGHKIGDRITLIGDSGRRTVTVVGSFFDGGDGYDLIAGDATTAGLGASSVGPPVLQIGVRSGTEVGAYVRGLAAKFPAAQGVLIEDRTADNDRTTFLVLYGLITTLTLMLCAVAALGVLNTVVLNTRERVHDIGVLKALGMTPRQVRAMVVTSMVGVGVLAGAVAVPLGVLLHHAIIPTMTRAAGTDVPSSIVDVYHPGPLVLMGAAGVVLAVLGALLPAGWAARTRVSTALRAE